MDITSTSMDLIVNLLFVVVHLRCVTSFYNPIYGAYSCTCTWKHGGQCKTACDDGEYVLGKLPCAFGYLGICCAKQLRCSDYGGVCRRGGCNSVNERAFTYRVKCPRSQTCCLRSAQVTSNGKGVLPGRTVNYRGNSNSVCGGRKRLSQRILGGSLVSSSCQWPWMVSIKLGTVRNPGALICAGVLISDNKVITTANCVLRRKVFVTVGENNPNQFGETGEEEINVIRKVVSRDFTRALAGKPLQRGDLAILTLASPVSYRGCTQPVCLPQDSDVITGSSRCFMAGWGYTSSTSNTSPSCLVEANVNVVGHRLCSLVLGLGANLALPTDKVCSSPFKDRTDACPGDKGGMLVCEDPAHRGVWSLFGVISDNTCSDSLPVVYTNLKSHLHWVKANV